MSRPPTPAARFVRGSTREERNAAHVEARELVHMRKDNPPTPGGLDAHALAASPYGVEACLPACPAGAAAALP
jgi:hypothetical protein